MRGIAGVEGIRELCRPQAGRGVRRDIRLCVSLSLWSHVDQVVFSRVGRL
jgi:hypothetical protein